MDQTLTNVIGISTDPEDAKYNKTMSSSDLTSFAEAVALCSKAYKFVKRHGLNLHFLPTEDLSTGGSQVFSVIQKPEVGDAILYADGIHSARNNGFVTYVSGTGHTVVSNYGDKYTRIGKTGYWKTPIGIYATFKHKQVRTEPTNAQLRALLAAIHYRCTAPQLGPLDVPATLAIRDEIEKDIPELKFIRESTQNERR